MHTTVLTAAFAAVAAAGGPLVFAQSATHDHSMMAQQSASAPAKAAPAEGEVRKVDRAKGTITLKHGPLTALNMGPMTMVFVAKDKKLLDNVKEGDKVRFTPEQAKDGELFVTTLEVVGK
jgi:Cu/Ag efflux protein CusF